MGAVSTIAPIFIVIFFGWMARSRGMAPPDFQKIANRLVYHLAIPAMIFRAISGTSLSAQFDSAVVGTTLGCVGIGFLLSRAAAFLLQLPSGRRGSFAQCSFHGNLGYIGFAVAFYSLGQTGLVRASIIAGFVMILQNLLAVVALQSGTNSGGGSLPAGRIIRSLAGNPVIVSALAGIAFSLSGLALPPVLDRCLSILSGMALPLALLLIGASLSFGLMREQGMGVVIVCAIKLVVMPGIALALFHHFGLDAAHCLPALILLACPVATLAFVMAGEMNGDPDFAVASVSASTLASAVTLTFWIHLGTALL